MPKYFNSTFGPLVYDDEGRIVGGGEWLTLDKPTEQIKKYLANREMVEVEEPKPETKTRTRKSQKETQE